MMLIMGCQIKQFLKRLDLVVLAAELDLGYEFVIVHHGWGLYEIYCNIGNGIGIDVLLKTFK